MTLPWFLRQGALHAILNDGFWKSDHDFLIAFHSNFLYRMHIGLRDNEILLPTGYDVIGILPPGGASRYFAWWFWKSDHDFLIAFHSNYLSMMHGFRDKVLLQARYDVIVISPPGDAGRNFLIADSERATPISYQCCIVTTRLSCTVSDLINFSCLPEMTS